MTALNKPQTLCIMGKQAGRVRPMSLRGTIALGATLLGLVWFSGCGSGSTPGESVKGQNAPTTAKSAATQGQAPSRLLIREVGSGPGKIEPVNKPGNVRLEEIFPGLNREELAARMAEGRKKLETPDNEVLPGLTEKEVKSKSVADKDLPPQVKQELSFGVSQEELNNKIAAGRERYYAPGHEILPGLTMEEYQSRQALGAAHRPDQQAMMGTFPGVNRN